MKFLRVSETVWVKASQTFNNLSLIIPVLVCVFSILDLPVQTLNFSTQVEENKSLGKARMKILEYSRKQSWKKVKVMLHIFNI